ncbi:hypothetical protein ACFQXB_19570 [Plastorhodobacter daqingensis]|uniref:DUF4169 domain-containing protein n=1 Tax=Plastorhodobacter daqingensis TaxID=1387281 RepID=A0ABW2UT54_9RHOB
MDKLPGRHEPARTGRESREERLKAALKANIARRKAQARLRDQADEDGETEQE